MKRKTNGNISFIMSIQPNITDERVYLFIRKCSELMYGFQISIKIVRF